MSTRRRAIYAGRLMMSEYRHERIAMSTTMSVIEELDFEREGRDWPLREHSRFVDCAATRVHVQEVGSGPSLILIHGTGASTHSWRDVIPLLAEDFRVIALDLPGHGFSQDLGDTPLSLAAMAAAVDRLLTCLEVRPDMIVGHSAGGAVAAQLATAHAREPDVIMTFNAAILPFPGVAGWLFPSLARLVFANPFAARFFANQARERRAVERLLRNTGSQIGEAGTALYQRLFTARAHVAATLDMMASWDLDALEARLGTLDVPLHLVVAGEDRAIPPERGLETARRVPMATTEFKKGLGHLAHEEEPAWAADAIRRCWQTHARDREI